MFQILVPVYQNHELRNGLFNFAIGSFSIWVAFHRRSVQNRTTTMVAYQRRGCLLQRRWWSARGLKAEEIVAITLEEVVGIWGRSDVVVSFINWRRRRKVWRTIVFWEKVKWGQSSKMTESASFFYGTKSEGGSVVLDRVRQNYQLSNMMTGPSRPKVLTWTSQQDIKQALRLSAF